MAEAIDVLGGLWVENSRLKAQIRELLAHREVLRDDALSSAEEMLGSRARVRARIEELTGQVEKGKRDREELLQKLEEYEQLPAEIAALKEEVETLYDQNYTLMSLLASPNFMDKKLKKKMTTSPLKSASTTQRTPSPSVVHKGVSEERDGYVVIKRLDAIEIRCGTEDKLIDWLVINPHEPDRYFTAFCLTYHSFTNGVHVLEQLSARYEQARPRTIVPASSLTGVKRGLAAPMLSDKASTRFDSLEEIARPDRLRIRHFLRHWLKWHSSDCTKSAEMICKFEALIQQIADAEGDVAALPIRKALERAVRDFISSLIALRTDAYDQQSATTTTKRAMFDDPPPAPHIPQKLPILSILDLEPIEVARQISLRDKGIYDRIEPQELQGLAWNSKEKESLAPNVLASIESFNHVRITGVREKLPDETAQLSDLVATSILEGPDLRSRGLLMSQWIEIAEGFRSLNNFNGVIAVISALVTSPIHRLKKSWERVKSSRRKSAGELEALMSSDNNYKLYRAELHGCSPPLVPYLDLTFIEEGNADLVESGQVNFVKRKMVAEVIEEVRQYQQSPYNVMPIDAILTFIDSASIMDEKDRYEVSLKREPRAVRKTPTKV